MKPSDLSGQAAIAGFGYQIRNLKDGDKPVSSVELQALACVQAMKEAGITRKQVGAFFTGRAPTDNMDPQWNMVMISAMTLAPVHSSSITMHGSGHLSMLKHAALAVCSGLVDYALCVTGSAGGMWLDLVATVASLEADPQFEAPFRPIVPSIYAQWATRYAYEFGITPRQAARVAVENRKWALHHPKAVMRDRGPLTVEDVLASRMIATPFHLLDCAPWYPGGTSVAVVVTRSDMAKELTDKPIYIQGFGECGTHENVTGRLTLKGIPPAEEGPNLHTSGIAVAARDAYAMSGWTPRDVDLFNSQSPFSYLNLIGIEDMGLCEKGEGGKFVESGGIDFEGGVPYNTSGGMLSFGQPNNTSPLLIETIQQLRGEAMGKQVQGARNGLVHFHGGPFAVHCVMLLSNQP